MNADVANLHQKCGRRVFVSPAGFVFQRQSVANRQRTCLLEHWPCARSDALDVQQWRETMARNYFVDVAKLKGYSPAKHTETVNKRIIGPETLAGQASWRLCWGT